MAESERPTDLEPMELSEYELVLEEEAFPFEEKAIDLHEENMELLQAGLFNPWTEKSLGKLAQLVPGRYAKSEIGGELLIAMDRYVYLFPACRTDGPILCTADAAPQHETTETMLPAAVAVNGGEADDATPR